MQVLSDIFAQRLSGRRALAASFVGAAFTAVCGQVAFHLPGNPVPITLQVFAVVCCGLMLGSRYGALSQLEYLVAGVAGAPVFSRFGFGPAWLIGPTGGYLVAFVAAAFVIGLIAERDVRLTFPTACIAGLAGMVTIHTIGSAWLGVYLGDALGWSKWMLGVLPFVGVDAVKVVVAALACSSRR